MLDRSSPRTLLPLLVVASLLSTTYGLSAQVEELEIQAPQIGGLDNGTWSSACDAADRGLDWLAAAQSEAGYWQAHVGHKSQDNYMILRSAEGNELLGEGHVGVTALCGMAFLSGGHLPDRGRFGDTLRRCVDYLLEHTTDSGLVTDGGTRMYSHAFATLFLAEIAGMDDDNRIRDGLQKAVHLIVDCQNRQGGWRYNAFTPEADISVTVCQLQALRAARNIGVLVPEKTIDDAVAFVLRARTPSGRFYYKNEGRSARTKSREYAINAAAATALLTAGVTNVEFQEPVLEFLLEDYDGSLRRYYQNHYFYWYGNYYACQAFFHAGDQRFATYHRRVTKDLLRAQATDGRWRNTIGPGDTFSTAVATILLQIPKQFLPIFQR